MIIAHELFDILTSKIKVLLFPGMLGGRWLPSKNAVFGAQKDCFYAKGQMCMLIKYSISRQQGQIVKPLHASIAYTVLMFRSQVSCELKYSIVGRNYCLTEK